MAGVQFTAAVDVVQAHCDVLVRREQFVRARGTEVWPDGTMVAHFEFRHALSQEVLSQRISVTRRMRLHHRMDEQLAQGYGP